jgi:hypothetical protein
VTKSLAFKPMPNEVTRLPIAPHACISHGCMYIAWLHVCRTAALHSAPAAALAKSRCSTGRTHMHMTCVILLSEICVGAQPGGWFLSLSVREGRAQQTSLGVPVSRAEFAVMRALANVRARAGAHACCLQRCMRRRPSVRSDRGACPYAINSQLSSVLAACLPKSHALVWECAAHHPVPAWLERNDGADPQHYLWRRRPGERRRPTFLARRGPTVCRLRLQHVQCCFSVSCTSWPCRKWSPHLASDLDDVLKWAQQAAMSALF